MWVQQTNVHGLQKLMPALEELGAESDEGLNRLAEDLEADGAGALRALKRNKQNI